MIEQALSEPFLTAGMAVAVAFLLLTALKDKDAAAQFEAEGVAYRWQVYRSVIVILWLAALAMMALWFLSGRGLEEFGFRVGEGRGWWITLALSGGVLLANLYGFIMVLISAKERRKMREQVGAMGDLRVMQPETPAQLFGWTFVSLSAGICEEIIFRGFLIAALALFMPLWAAAALSIALFTVAHAYQGGSGMIRVLFIATVLTGLFLASGSLYPVMAVHFAVDMFGGLMIYTAVRGAS